jgi:hypothetical protein
MSGPLAGQDVASLYGLAVGATICFADVIRWGQGGDVILNVCPHTPGIAWHSAALLTEHEMS